VSVRRGAIVLVVASVVASFAPPSFAQPKKPEPAPAPAPGPPPKTSALVYVSTEIARALGQVPAGAIVVVSPLASDVAAPKADELAVKIGAQIAGRIGVAKAHPSPAPLAVARGVSGRAASLVYVQLEIVRGELRATADLYPVVSNGWERLRNPVPGPRAHAFATAPLDAELRSFLVPVMLEQTSLHRAKHEETDVLAVGCGDVDGDGGLELVVVSRSRVALGRLRAGKFVVDRSAPWSSIASRAPVPMREPLASAVVSPRDHRGEILLGTTDRGGVVIDGQLVAKRQLTGIPVPGGEGEACALVNAEQSSYEGVVVSCTTPPKGDPAAVLAPPAPRYDAISALDSVGKDGSVVPYLAVREPSGKLRLRRNDPIAAPPRDRSGDIVIDGIGAQIALVDLDLDGVPEIATTTENEADMLVVSAITKNGVAARLRFPAKDGVRALGACPPEAKGAPALVAVTSSEVWLVR
jgi:hypothetical protein